jgi:hypothetical protein
VIVSTQLSSPRSLLALLLLCGGLAGAMAVELISASEADWSAPEAATAPSLPSANIPKTSSQFTLPPLESFAEIAERPLFSSSRRPPAIDAAQTVDQPFSATLAGIVISTSSRNIIVAHGDPPVLTRLKEGDNLDGWSVSSIEPNRVLFQRGSEERQLKLSDVPGKAAGQSTTTSEPTSKSHR